MNILLINTHNPLKASGIVAHDLFRQFRQTRHDVKLVVNSFSEDYPEGIISLESSLSSRWKLLLEKIAWRFNRIKDLFGIKDKTETDPNYHFFQISEKIKIFKTRRILKAAGNKPDIIIILFAKGFINTKNIYELGKITGARIFWLMFDMAPFTGGCHYAWECTGYQRSCGSCPGLFSSDPLDVSYENLIYKKSFLDKTDIQILAGSEWQYNQASLSSLFRDKIIHKILLPIDSKIFKPVDKKELRVTMKIPPDKKIIFFGAVGLSEKRKGMLLLIESLNRLKEIMIANDPDMGQEVLLLIAGKGLDTFNNLFPFESHYLGYLDNTYGIASAYQAADLFLCPSIEDSGPMMINQSVMCGTPVVSFEMGVALDLVTTGKTGYRARLKDTNDMALGIYNILKLSPGEYARLSSQCRDNALRMSSFESWMVNFENIISKKVSD